MDNSLFSFFISGEKKEIFPGSRLWETPLSGENVNVVPDGSVCTPPLKVTITIGDYFSAARKFLLKDNSSVLKSGLGVVCKRPVPTGQISKIAIFLEKHGALYHPLKVQIFDNKVGLCSFVLNGAVSKPGLSLISKEYRQISSLNKICLKHYLPRVFGSGFIQADKTSVGFFLGEWFDGFKEFHATEVQGKRKVVIWESDGSCHYISETDALGIYREISRILTYYYHLETFEQIFPWHHAAGDFIVKKDYGNIQVRLITVRGYAPVSDFNLEDADKKKYILPSLLVFFLNLVFRLRFDRLEGTGQTVILGEPVIKAGIDGFLDGLDTKSADFDYGNLRLVFLEFFKQFNFRQVMEMMENVLESYPPYPSETALIKENIESHCKILHAIFRNI